MLWLCTLEGADILADFFAFLPSDFEIVACTETMAITRAIAIQNNQPLDIVTRSCPHSRRKMLLDRAAILGETPRTTHLHRSWSFPISDL